MNITTQIKVGNNSSLGFDTITVTLRIVKPFNSQESTTCYGFITFSIPLADGTKEIELDRKQLREFLARTQAAFVVQYERYEAEQ
jgi:hypothetical protein